MPRWNLADISRKSAKNQAEVIAQMGPKTALPVSSPAPEVETPGKAAGSPAMAIHITDSPLELGETPVYIPAYLLRHILDNFGAAFYVAKDETQRRAVVQHAVQALARREANPHSIP